MALHTSYLSHLPLNFPSYGLGIYLHFTLKLMKDFIYSSGFSFKFGINAEYLARQRSRKVVSVSSWSLYRFNARETGKFLSDVIFASGCISAILLSLLYTVFEKCKGDGEGKFHNDEETDAQNLCLKNIRHNILSSGLYWLEI